LDSKKMVAKPMSLDAMSPRVSVDRKLTYPRQGTGISQCSELGDMRNQQRSVSKATT
jgi:hypothetical protein